MIKFKKEIKDIHEWNVHSCSKCGSTWAEHIIRDGKTFRTWYHEFMQDPQDVLWIQKNLVALEREPFLWLEHKKKDRWTR